MYIIVIQRYLDRFEKSIVFFILSQNDIYY